MLSSKVSTFYHKPYLTFSLLEQRPDLINCKTLEQLEEIWHLGEDFWEEVKGDGVKVLDGDGNVVDAKVARDELAVNKEGESDERKQREIPGMPALAK